VWLAQDRAWLAEGYRGRVRRERRRKPPMTAARPAPIGQSAPVPELPPVPGLDAMEHDVLTFTVLFVVQSPPSHVVVDVAVPMTLIGVVSIELSEEMHWLTSPALT
jgi:hypothetical protein